MDNHLIEGEGDARGLDPTDVVADHQARVHDALESGEPEVSREELRTYLDVEDRIILDVAERVGPEFDDDVAAARAQRDEVLHKLDRDAEASSVRVLFDRHVRQTDSLFRALWSHLDETGRDDVAGALEEARLSREEADNDLQPRPNTRSHPRERGMS